ncbi:hypothetical protein NSA47_13690 [Irregularibacter muris]|uniref:Uncharacterized protein n=1 Tax=Irregularibacter muris TaxID=1796619 RepID=A0AAE3L0J0_9FIRM|nr:hypothetical protein [Irregularibacter muris]MCR1900017.1 hypothetical protein [Irregularibacter muris]
MQVVIKGVDYLPPHLSTDNEELVEENLRFILKRNLLIVGK